MKNKKNIPGIQTKFLFNMILIAVVSIALWSLVWVQGEFADFNKMAGVLRRDYLESQKEMLREQVTRVAFYLAYIKKMAKPRGAQESDDEYKERIQNLVLDYVVTLRFGKDGYFFGSTWQGGPLFSNGKITIGTGSIWELTDPNGVKIIREQQFKARQKDGGFVAYEWYKLNSSTPSPKISFVMGMPDWEWTIGAGVYLDTIETTIQDKKKDLKTRLMKKIFKSLWVLAFFIVIIALWARWVSGSIQAEIDRILQFLKTADSDTLTIEPETFKLRELKLIALSINRVFLSRNQAVEELRKSKNHNRAMIQAIPDLLFLIDENCRFVDSHAGNNSLLSMPREKIIGKTLGECLPRDVADLTEKKIKKILKTGGTESYTYSIEVNGDRMLFDARIVPYDSNHALAISRNMTEQKRTELQLELLAMAVKHTAESIIIVNTRGRIEYVNPAFEKTTGYTAEEVIGWNPSFLQSDEQDESAYQKMVDTLKGGESWQGRLINRRKDGSSLHEHVSVSPVVDPDGNITHYVSVKRDRSHEMRMEQRLSQAQKMEAIGSLAGGIAHDFNNILSPVMGHAGILMNDLSRSNPLYNNADKIYKAALRARDLVRQILTFSRRDETEIKPVNLRPVVKEAVKLLRASIPKTIDIQLRVEPEIRKVLADATQVHQVLMNLATNAYHAMDDNKGGVIKIALEHQVLRLSSRNPDVTPEAEAYMKLSVADTGEGIPEDILHRILDPYFTTKPEGRGTGLGLSIVHGIVKSFNGELMIKSTLGKGTEVSVFLPVAVNDQSGMVEINNTPVPTGSERILFVDDEDFIVEIQTEILQRLGYQVTSVIESPEALKIFKTAPDNFDLLITDMTMPEMTGLQLAEGVKKIRPDLPVIICTGFNKNITKKRYREMNIDGYVSKPAEIKDMGDTIRRVIDEAQNNRSN